MQRPAKQSVVEQAVFSLTRGQVSEILAVETGLILVKALEVVEPSQRLFTDVRDGIRARLETERHEQVQQAAGRELRTATPPVVNEAAVAHYQYSVVSPRP